MGNLIENRQIRVFISSTFQDMQDERNYLMKHTFPVLRKLAAERDVTLTELDLRWGITEEEAKTGKVVEICLREIENSIPFFIGIIGNRYGWVPEKKDIGENVTERFKDVNNYLERHLSVTEMEMQFGVLQRKEDMHAYFYIKEGEDKENADNPKMLERLKKEVKASRYPSTTYSSPENLGIQVEQAFRTLLDRIFPEGHLSELEKERIGQRSFMRQLCQNYIRDDKNFQVIDEWISDWDQHQLVVTGASGLGKSALIANWLKEELSDENRGYNIIYHFTGNGGSESNHEHIMKILIDEINDIYGWDASDEMNRRLKDKQGDKLNDMFIKVASEGKKPLLIVLDAINQIVDTENAKLLNWLPIPPKNIKILFSTLEDDRTMEVFLNRHYPTFILQPISTEHRRQLINTYLGWFSKKLTNEQVERIVNDRQCENTLALKTLLDELINFGVYEKLDERIDYFLLPDSIEDFYQVLLKSYEEDYNGYCEDFIKHVLSLIVLSRNGLSEEEILKATGIKPLYWSQFYCAFSTHLISKEGLISFAHRYVQNAVSARYTDNEDWVRACRNEILNVVDDANTIRYLEEQTYQFDQLGEYEKLHDLLLDFETFSTYYKLHPYELCRYWQHLRSIGYSITDYLQIKEESTRTTHLIASYSTLTSFSLEYLADYSSALSFSERTMEEIEKLDNAKIIFHITSYMTIGNVFNAIGEYNKALRFHMKTLETQEKKLGREHPVTAMTYNNIGIVYGNMGDFDKALEFFIRALEIDEKRLGSEHAYTTAVYRHIGNVYLKKGRVDKALEYLMRTLEIEGKKLGNNHLDIANTNNSIGAIYDAEGMYDKALEYYMKALEIEEKLLGNEHPTIAISYYNIGSLYGKKRNIEKALKFLQRSLEIKEKVHGKNHLDLANTYNNLGVVYDVRGIFDKALEYYMKALKIREKVFGYEHIDTLSSLHNIGLVFERIGEYNKAILYNMKALEIEEKLLGNEHLHIANSYNNIGVIYSKNGNYNKALKCYLRSLEIKELKLGKNHPSNASLYNNIGILYSTRGDYNLALKWHTKAAKLGFNNSYNELAWTYHLMGKYVDALPYAENAVKAVPNNVEYIDTLATIYQGLRRYYEALEKFELCLKLKKEQMASENSIHETEEKIAALKDLMKS